MIAAPGSHMRTTGMTAAAVAALLLAVLAPGPAGGATPPAVPYDSSFAPLTRIGDQLTRGDQLTGHGAPAPFWIPEQP